MTRDHDTQECVICGTVYISETDSNGRERLVSLDATVATPTQSKEDAVASSVVPPSTTTFLAKDKGKGRAPEKEATKEVKINLFTLADLHILNHNGSSAQSLLCQVGLIMNLGLVLHFRYPMIYLRLRNRSVFDACL